MQAQVKQVRGNASRRSGFTLIELVVVLVILAIVAGLTVSIVDWIRRAANYGVAANNQQSLLNNLQLFRTTYGNGKYPDLMDSLLNDDASAASDWLTSDLAGVFTVGPLAGEEQGTLTRSGFTRVMDHSDDTTSMVQGSPQNSGIIQRTLTTTASVALVTPFAASNPTTNKELWLALYPDVDNDGLPNLPLNEATGEPEVRLVLFGVGAANTAVGKTISSPPLYTELNPQEEYGRFIIAVAVYNPRNGRRAQVKAVLDPKGRLVNRQVSEFWQSMNPD